MNADEQYPGNWLTVIWVVLMIALVKTAQAVTNGARRAHRKLTSSN